MSSTCGQSGFPEGLKDHVAQASPSLSHHSLGFNGFVFFLVSRLAIRNFHSDDQSLIHAILGSLIQQDGKLKCLQHSGHCQLQQQPSSSVRTPSVPKISGEWCQTQSETYALPNQSVCSSFGSHHHGLTDSHHW